LTRWSVPLECPEGRCIPSMTQPTESRSSALSNTSTGSPLPEPPRDGFELGAIDVSAERPAHALSSSRSTRWLVGGLVGGSLLLAGLITLVRGDDDAPARADGVELRAVLRDPLSATLASLESVRLDAVTVSAVRALGDAPPSPPKATHRSPTRDDTATPAATAPKATTSSTDPPATPRGSAAPAIGTGAERRGMDLPPPPDEEAGRAEPSSPPPAEPAPAEPRPTVDAAEADESDAPSGV
jgi:hypothetical protein